MPSKPVLLPVVSTIWHMPSAVPFLLLQYKLLNQEMTQYLTWGQMSHYLTRISVDLLLHIHMHTQTHTVTYKDSTLKTFKTWGGNWRGVCSVFWQFFNFHLCSASIDACCTWLSNTKELVEKQQRRS